MTPEDVRARVAAVAAIGRGDQEAAHSAEDALHQAVLKAIADGAEDAPALAAEALKTLDLEFTRWYA